MELEEGIIIQGFEWSGFEIIVLLKLENGGEKLCKGELDDNWEVRSICKFRVGWL